MSLTTTTSFRASVFEWCRQYPWVPNHESNREYNQRLYKAFNADLPKDHSFSKKEATRRFKQQSILRKYRTDYEKELHRSILNQEQKPIRNNNRNIRNITKKKVEKQADKDKPKLLPLPIEGDPKFKEFFDLPDIQKFFHFCRWHAFPHYRGLFTWQKDCHEELHLQKYKCIKAPRDHGKSIYLGDDMQYDMQYGGWDILYLGWTDRRKEVSENVVNFFEQNDLMDNKKSNFHFTIKNGGKFDCYLIKSKDILGMHSVGDQARFKDLTEADIQELQEYYEEFNESTLKDFLENINPDRRLKIVIDDPIDDTFEKERWKEDDLERRFVSTIYNINPDQWIFTGTRKFKGDFFDFIDKTFGNRLVEFKRKTHLEEGQKRYNADLKNNPKNILCPERFTEPGMPKYEQDIVSRDEGGAGKRDLDEIYTALKRSGRLYWWFAEYEQDPHPMTSEVWKGLKMVDFLESPLTSYYELRWITIDRATTRKSEASKKDADYTGCVLGLREFETGHRIITDDWSGYIDINVLLLRVCCYVIEHRMRYNQIDVLLVIETQGGGSDFVTFAINLPEYSISDGRDMEDLFKKAEYKKIVEDILDSKVLRDFVMYDEKTGILRVPNLLREYCTIKEVHNTGEKMSRIRNRLNGPITTKTLKVLRAVQGSEVITELLDYPHCSKIDAADALANVEHIIMELYPIISKNQTVYGDIEKLYHDFEDGKLDELPDPNKPIPSHIERMLARGVGVREKKRTVF